MKRLYKEIYGFFKPLPGDKIVLIDPSLESIPSEAPGTVLTCIKAFCVPANFNFSVDNSFLVLASKQDIEYCSQILKDGRMFWWVTCKLYNKSWRFYEDEVNPV